jgi:hypothetical protein
MAYVSQEKKAEIAPVIKALLKKYNLKGSLSVNNHSTLVLTIKSGAIDFIKNYNDTTANNAQHNSLGGYVAKDHLDVNTYWIDDHYTGKAKTFLKEAKKALEGKDFFNNDDAMTDYFHRSHYIDINVGKWNKAYVVTK